MARWNGPRTRIQLKLAIQRSRMLQEKKEALAKRSRMEIAELVERGKIESARVKTESLIMDDVHVELLELLELYCETLYARFALMELKSSGPDEAIREPLVALIHAAHRTELQELHVLQDMLCARYGADFSQEALDNQDNCVSERVTRKLAFHMPSSELVDAYLSESMYMMPNHAVCKTYKVPFPSSIDATATDTSEPELPPESDPIPAAAAEARPQSEWDHLMARFQALKRP